MARTVEDIQAARQPGAARPAPARRRQPILGWICVAVAVAAVATLAFVVILPTDREAKPIGQPLIAEHGSIRASEGSVEDAQDRRVPPQTHVIIAEHGSIRAIEGSVEDSAGRARAAVERFEREAHLAGQARTHGNAARGAAACTWTTHVDEPVLPPADLGPRPEPDSELLFEQCDGEHTGRMRWS
jgi:hypothetical protein